MTSDVFMCLLAIPISSFTFLKNWVVCLIIELVTGRTRIQSRLPGSEAHALNHYVICFLRKNARGSNHSLPSLASELQKE